MMKIVFAPTLLAVSLLCSCSGLPPSDGSAPEEPEENPPPSEQSFSLRLSAPRLPILQGTREVVEVTVVRRGGFSGAVTIEAVGLPEGASYGSVTIPKDEDSVSLEIEADAMAPHSLPTPVEIVGTSGDESDSEELTVTIYGPPGSLDTSFRGGVVTENMSQSDDYARAMALQNDGKIVVVGHGYDHLGDFAVLRLERDGQLDASFGDGGKVLIEVGSGADVAYAVAIQEDGKIVIAGSSASDEGDLDFGLVRLLPNGDLDDSFGNGGKVRTSFSDDSDVAYALLVGDDGKIVVGGETSQGSSATGLDFALARYEASGALDPSFGDGGKVTTALASGSGRDSIYALSFHLVGGETRIVAAGGEGDFALARYLPSGDLDPGFGEDGKLSGLFGSTIGAARGVAVDPRGNIVVAGHSHHDFALARLQVDGRPDKSFGEQGLVTTAVSEDNWDEATALVLEESGSIALGGWVYEGNGSAGNFALLRYDEKGALDPIFARSGIVVTDVAGPTERDEAAAVVLQSDPRVPTVRVLLAGSAASSDSDFAVARFWR